jgi:hypothetical protein
MPKECKLTVYPAPDFRTSTYGRTTNVWGFNKKSDIGFGGAIKSWQPPERSSYTCSPDATIIGFANQNRHGNRIVLPIKAGRYRGMNIESIGIWWPLQDIDWNKNISAKMKTPPNTFISGMRNDACPGGDGYFTSKYHGSNYLECVYDKYDETRLRTLHATTSGSNDKALTFSDLKTKFCAVSENVFKNPGGGSCLEYDTSKALAKEYCSVGDRIATDGSCTSVNLGNFYAGVAEAYCKTTAGKADPWCSCYNVNSGVCDTDSSAAGCAQKKETYDKLVEATPEEYKNSWNGMAACFGGVCTGDKYIPENSNQNCNRPVQVCVQDFDIQGIADSTINATCEQTANVGTPPSTGDGPSGTPSGTPSVTPSGTPSGTPSVTPSGTPPGTPSGGIGDYIPQSLDDIRNDSKKQLAVGGVGALFMMCCCLLIIIVLMSSGGGRGPSRFRR